MKILIGCTGLKSQLFSSVTLGRKLRDAGHSIFFIAPEDCVSSLEHAGFDYAVIGHAKTGIATAYDTPFQGERTPSSKAARTKAGIQSIREDGIAAILTEQNPDAVIMNTENHAGIIQTLAAGIPIGLITSMYLTPANLQKPPVNSAIIPGEGWRGSRLAIGLKWVQVWRSVKQMRKKVQNQYWGADSETVHRALARELGVNLDKITSVWAFQAPWTWRLPTMFLVPQEIDFPVRLWPGQIYAGPMVSKDRPKSQPNETVKRFFSASATKKVYASFGTVRAVPSDFAEKLVQIAERNPDWTILTTLKDMTGREGLPANLLSTDWAPQVDMLEEADCAIFHGGAGTMNECVATATPMLVFPNGLDGAGNGARIVHHGVGKMRGFNAPVEKIEADLNSLLSQPARVEKLKRIAEAQIAKQIDLEMFVKGLLRS